MHIRARLATASLTSLALFALAVAQAATPVIAVAAKKPKPWVTPTLPGGTQVVTDTSPEFLKPPETLAPDVKIAKAVPTVDFGYYPCQTYEAEIWSVWGDSTCAGGKYYASLGDHMYAGNENPASPGHHGSGYIFEYDPATKKFRQLLDTSQLLKMPANEYTPGKIHSRLDLGKDGWIYCSTHRGSQSATTDKFNYQGDWILRCNPKTGAAEVVVHAPVPKHCLPNGMLDPERMIFYGGTAIGDGEEEEDIRFFAYDVVHHKMLYEGRDGPSRCMILAKSTGKVYYTPKLLFAPLMCYDPSSGQPPRKIPGEIGIRAATAETPQGMVYTISQGPKDRATGKVDSTIYSFNTKTEQCQRLGPAAISKDGLPDYVATMVVDPSGRYVYYTVGAHGGSERVGSALVQYDTRSKQKKVIAFLHPFYQQKYAVTPRGSFSMAIDEKGETVYITWNCKREGNNSNWDTVGMTAVHIPASERAL